MQTESYFQLNKKQRASLDEAMLKDFVTFECMLRGVIIPPKPLLLEVPEMPEIKKRLVYKIQRGYYGLFTLTDPEEAKTFLGFKSVVRVGTDYNIGLEYIESAEGQDSLMMTPEEVMSKEEKERVAVIAKFRKENLAKNEELEKEYNNALEDVESIENEIRHDHSMLLRERSKGRQIIETWFDYRRMANNDSSVAFEFLKKVYYYDQIKEALFWWEERFATRPLDEERQGFAWLRKIFLEETPEAEYEATLAYIDTTDRDEHDFPEKETTED